jgi:hypothetical protein
MYLSLLVILPVSLANQPDAPMLNSIATADYVGKLFLKLNTLSIDYVVPIAEIEETIDFLSFKVTTMKYATDLEKLRPISLRSGDLTFTVFQSPLTLHMASSVCTNFKLKPLTITDLPTDFKVPFSIYSLTFHFELYLSDDRLTCLTPSNVLSDTECLDLLQTVTKSDPSFPVQQELRDYLTKNMTTSKSLYLSMERNKFQLTPNSYGISACVGEIAVQTSNDIKRLHDHFFSKLIQIFEHIFDIIDLTVYHLSDTLLTIAAEESDPIQLPFNVSSLDLEILELIPQLLPNIVNHNSEVTDFDLFFKTCVNTSQDAALYKLKLSQTEIKNLTEREKSIVYASLLQFNIAVKKRLAALTTNIFNSTNHADSLSNYLLFDYNQSPFSFKNLLLNTMRISEEDISLEYFLIIQNQKNTLFQNIAHILNIEHRPVHLSRAMFSTIARRKPPPISSVIELRKLKELAGKAKAAPTASFTRPPNMKSAARPKRSWGGFWGDALSLATQEDMNKVLEHELSIGDNELKLSKSLWNITITNSQMISSLKTVTSGISKLVTEEQSIFDQIDEIMGTEEKYLTQMNDLLNMVDRSVALVADYQMIQLQVSLLIHLTDKVKSLVTAILTNTVDVTQIPLTLFKSHLQDNLKTTLRLAQYKLLYSAQGTVLNIHLPVLSNPYYMYTFRIIPFYLDGTWYQPITPKDIAINAINEVLDVQETRKKCTQVNDDLACDSEHARVYKFSGLAAAEDTKKLPKYRSELLCAIRTLKNIENPATNTPYPCGLELYYTLDEQKYIFKGNKLMLASPVSDMLTSQCENSKENTVQKIHKSLNTLTVNENCHYETSQMVIHRIEKLQNLEKIADFDELDTVKAVSNLDNLLEQSFTTVRNMSLIRQQLKKYNTSLVQNKHTVEELSKTLSIVDSIHQITKFDPTTIDLSQPFATSNWITAIFWTLVLLVIAIIIYGSYQRCPSKCTSCFAIPLIIIKHMCCACIQVVQKAATASYQAAPQTDPESHPRTSTSNNKAASTASCPTRNSNILHNYSYKETQFLVHNPTTLQWTIQTAAYEAYSIQSVIAISDAEFKRIKYNTILNIVSDMENNPLAYVPNPPAQTIEKYKNMLRNASPTETFTDSENTIRHKKYAFLVFKPATCLWTNHQTNQAVTGLSNPAEYANATCY